MSQIIKEKLKTAPTSYGVYTMLGKGNQVLYIGKAKNIRNRLEQYLNPKSERIAHMTSQITDIRFVVCKTEEEALMLEMSNIKSTKPKYNILLKDGKSFPQIFISAKEDFPQIRKHRGKRSEKGDYFGPFGSSDDVYKTIDAVEKFFQLRTCKDSEFSSRTRPCLKYQLKRCTAPCVGLVSQVEYRKQVQNAIKFLKGKTGDVQKSLSDQMERFSVEMEFERAAVVRDKIIALSKIQMSDKIEILENDNMDVLGIEVQNNTVCIQVFFIRDGYNCGNKAYFLPLGDFEKEEIFYQFIHQFYTENSPPSIIYVDFDINHLEGLEKILNTKIEKPKSERIKKIMDFANNNAKNSMNTRFEQSEINKDFMEKIAKTFNLSKTPKRIELFDNSHISGEYAVGAMISLTEFGFDKSTYRKYNFDKSINQMDDYEMMHDMLYRRAMTIKELIAKQDFDKVPDLWIIDGGSGHVSTVVNALSKAKLDIDFICVSKGVDRNAGNEFFHTKDLKNIFIERKSELIYYLQKIRDEVHRFAITSHRKKRDKDISKSVLDEISGIGKVRKINLLRHFGSVDLISKASIDELERVDGVNKKSAKAIHDFFQI